MKCVKLFVSVLVIPTFYASAQVRLPINNALRSDFQKIISAYPKQFEGVRGEIINQNPQSIEYVSNIKVGNAQECSVIKYSSGLKQVYSWQGIMFRSEDFEEASKKYKSVFNQLKGLNIFYVEDQYTLRGDFAEADESLKFTSSILAPAAPPEPLKKLKIEVALQFEFPEWKVNLLVYEKEREDDERGEIAE